MENYPVISVITVVYNGIAAIKKTIHSVLNQNYPNIDYVIIDGASKDGTQEIIKAYESKLGYYISEPDCGIYDAMNKGISAAKGDWIMFMNCGDFFYSDSVLSEIFVHYSANIKNADVIYGNSKMYYPDGRQIELKVLHPISCQWKGPVFRHGTMLVKSSILKSQLFRLENEFKISADFELMYRLNKKGFNFQYLDIIVLLFQKEGVSDNGIRNLKDNYYIIKMYGDSSPYRWMYYQYRLIKEKIAGSAAYHFFRQVFRNNIFEYQL